MDTSAAAVHFLKEFGYGVRFCMKLLPLLKKVSLFYGGVSIKIKRFIIKMLSALRTLFTLNK